MGEHAKLPWAVCKKAPNEYWDEGITIYDVAGERRVADATKMTIDGKANAAFIVKAVNNHYQLLDALKCICSLYPKDMSDDGSGRIGFNSTSQAFIGKAQKAIKEAEK